MSVFTTAFCFDRGAVTGALIADVIEAGLGFEPDTVHSDVLPRKGAKFSRSKHVGLFRTAMPETVRVETRTGMDGPSFQLATVANWNMQVMYWKNVDPGTPSRELIERLVSVPGFNAGYRYNNEDVFWQSETSVTTYETFGKPHAHLPRNGVEIDISSNPGRRTLFPGMWLQAAWEMWLGPGALEFISRDRVMHFAAADEIRDLGPHCIFVRLYRDGDRYADRESLRRLAAFRQWVGMDEFERQAAVIAEGRVDPVFEVETGMFEHGGVRLEVHWLDDAGKPARRSRASRSRRLEFDADGKLVWSSPH